MAYIKKIGPDIVGIFKLPFQQNNVKLNEFYISWESKRVFRLFVYSINSNYDLFILSFDQNRYNIY